MKISISGIRGIYGDDLSLHDVVKFSRIFGSFISKFGTKTCFLARDTRPSSDILLKTVCAGLMAQGIDIFNIGIAPTPVAFRESRKYKSALIVTASHNPLEWNGLKFVIEGRGIFEDELDSMLKSPISSSTTYGNVYDVHSSYIQDVIDLMKKNGYTENKEKKKIIGLDPGGGAACGYAPELFKALGQKYYSVNDVATISSRTPDPTSDDLLELCELVKGNNLDFGFAFDMDGDRLVVIDKNGQKLSPDLTLLLCITNTLLHGLKKYVTSIDTSNAVRDLVKAYGATLDYSKVGEANVVQKMIELSADAGGEGSSAGFIIPEFNMCRDGILAGAIISSSSEKAIEECMTMASKYKVIRSKIPIDSSKYSSLIEKLEDKFKEDSYDLLKLDGLKVLVDENSWILIRPSNTEHALRISIESEPDKVSELYKKMKERVISIYEQIK
jgi:phosphomannomutase